MQEIKEIPIGEIKVGEHDQRLQIDDNSLDGLAVSIRRVGVLVPLILEEKDSALHLVAGHRRLLAALRVGLSTVPCIIKDSTKVESSEITFAENFFRKDLSPVELAAALKDVLEREAMTVNEIAEGFDRTEHWVHSMVAICSWPADVQEAMHVGGLSISAASNLACVTEDIYREFLVRNAVEGGVTARTTAAWLQAWRAQQPVEQAVKAEPVPGAVIQQPAVPQGPCFICGQVYLVNEMSHVPMCGACVKAVRSQV